MTGCNWLWLAVVGCGWLWLWWLALVDRGWLRRIGCGSKLLLPLNVWLSLIGCDWLRLVAVGCGWLWLAVAAGGWLCVAYVRRVIAGSRWRLLAAPVCGNLVVSAAGCG